MRQLPYEKFLAVTVLLFAVSISIYFLSRSNVKSGDCFSVDDILSQNSTLEDGIGCSEYAEILYMALNEKPWHLEDYQGPKIYEYSLIKQLIRSGTSPVDRWDVRFRIDDAASTYWRLLTHLETREWFGRDRYELYSLFILNEAATQMGKTMMISESDKGLIENIFIKNDFQIKDYDISDLAECFVILDVFDYETAKILNSSLYEQCADS